VGPYGPGLAMTDAAQHHVANAVHGRAPASAVDVSGTYYVQCPRDLPHQIRGPAPRTLHGCALDRRALALRNRPWITLPAVAGQVVLFESGCATRWRPIRSRPNAFSVSFNYNWF